eukprot:Skav227694  [mRNA]  locus=scaffold2761:109738:113467:- [translate_table: standard]
MHYGNGAPAGVYKSSTVTYKCVSRHILTRPEEILLVDDVRTNFQSGVTTTTATSKKVFRCCKEDYRTLVEFANRPWAFNVDCQAHCLERPFEEASTKPPVKLVIFDFDGALTLCTFMPEDPHCSTDIRYTPQESLKQRYVQYNFETPYLEGSRVDLLGSLLNNLAHDPETGERRVLAILTINEAGAIGVLNLLRMAGLSNPFSAIWTLSTRTGQPGGVYQEDGEWKTFTLPQQIAERRYKPSAKS